MNFNLLASLVPCGTSTTAPCTVCDLFVLLQNVLNFLVITAASLVTLAVVYIAFLFLFSGGSSKKITDAKDKLWLVLWGIFWIFGSWLVLNTIINAVADQSKFPWKFWYQVDCKVSQQSPISEAIPVPQPILPESAMSETEARNRFQQAGIAVNHSNACPAGVTTGCTSLAGITATTLLGAVQLKNNCQCDLTISGGTEQGHATGGTLSHANGNKLDFRPNTVLDSYIQKNFTSLQNRSDGAKQYRDPVSGSVYARESDHWDVTFRQ